MRPRLRRLMTLMSLVLVATLIAPPARAQVCDTGVCETTPFSDTGDKPAPTTDYELTYVDPADPVEAAAKRADLAANYAEQLAAVDLVDAGVETGLGTSYNHFLGSVPYYSQATNYWCGPASTRQVLGYFNSTPPSQSFLADKLGTTRDGTWFPMVKNVLNNRRPNDQPWLLDPIDTHGDLISRMDYGGMNQKPGVLHVVLLRQYYPYYNYDHGGHIATAAGLRRNGQRYFGGYVDPYNEATYSSGGATTGGFRENRIYRLFDATRANRGDMIF